MHKCKMVLMKPYSSRLDWECACGTQVSKARGQFYTEMLYPVALREPVPQIKRLSTIFINLQRQFSQRPVPRRALA